MNYNNKYFLYFLKNIKTTSQSNSFLFQVNQWIIFVVTKQKEKKSTTLTGRLKINSVTCEIQLNNFVNWTFPFFRWFNTKRFYVINWESNHNIKHLATNKVVYINQLCKTEIQSLFILKFICAEFLFLNY